MSGENILIVDDTPANLRLLSQMLAGEGYHVRPLPDGPLALAAARAEPPDLILLDIKMPGMDGYQVCQHLKAEAQTRDIPIIFISALDAVQDKIDAFAAGGVDYVTKPFHAREVLARVATHLALRETQKQLEEANETMARELALAGEIQLGFLPAHLPAIPGWHLAATLQPARQASGDFYDLLSLPGDRLGLVVADVSDKGAGAALYMALCCTILRTYAAQYPGQPELLLAAANQRILQDCSANQFVTVFYGILDPDTGDLTYANAGHCPPLVLRPQKAQQVQWLTQTGVPLGILEDRAWGQAMIQLDPGELLVVYTDGITEAHYDPRLLFGEERLLASVRAALGAAGRERPAPQAIQDAIWGEVQEFLGGAPQSDDIALIILQRS
jgi:sigma-B regulation protein RsbU (phosphoserine phosphatase)